MEMMGEHKYDFIAPYFVIYFCPLTLMFLNASPLGLSFLNVQSAKFGSARIGGVS